MIYDDEPEKKAECITRVRALPEWAVQLDRAGRPELLDALTLVAVADPKDYEELAAYLSAFAAWLVAGGERGPGLTAVSPASLLDAIACGFRTGASEN